MLPSDLSAPRRSSRAKREVNLLNTAQKIRIPFTLPSLYLFIMSEHFVNFLANAIPERMQGPFSNTSLVTLVDPSTGHSTAVRSFFLSFAHKPRVSVIGGGGSGHEPTATNYVRDDVLADATDRVFFSSLSVPADAGPGDRVVSSSEGILVVLMTFESDRVKFAATVDDLKTQNPTHLICVIVRKDDNLLSDVAELWGIAGTSLASRSGRGDPVVKIK